MIDFNKASNKIKNTVIAENMDFEREQTYCNGNQKKFTNQFILDNIDKINFNLLFIYKKFNYEKYKDTLFVVFKYCLEKYIENHLKSLKEDNFYYNKYFSKSMRYSSCIKNFFRKIKLDENEMIKYLSYMWNNKERSEIHCKIIDIFTQYQNITGKVIDYLIENKMQFKNEMLFCINTQLFIQFQSVPAEFYNTNSYFKKIKEDVFNNKLKDENGYTFIRYQQYSFEDIETFLNNMPKTFLENILCNNRLKLTKSEYKKVIRLYMKKTFKENLNKNAYSQI